MPVIIKNKSKRWNFPIRYTTEGLSGPLKDKVDAAIAEYNNAGFGNLFTT